MTNTTLLSVADKCREQGISRATLYRAIERGYIIRKQRVPIKPVQVQNSDRLWFLPEGYENQVE